MNNTIDEQFIEYIVKSLVSNPDEVSIKRTIDEKGVLLELTVAQEDLGRVIGKRGAGAQALRTLLRALGTKHDARYNLKIVDVGEPPVKREHKNEEASAEKSEEQTEEVQQEAPAVEEAEAPAEETVDSSSYDDDDDRFGRTRRELADLDDLDI